MEREICDVSLSDQKTLKDRKCKERGGGETGVDGGNKELKLKLGCPHGCCFVKKKKKSKI